MGYGTSAPPADADNQREAFCQLFPNLRSQRIILFLSRIHPKKGVDLLIEGFAAVAPKDPRLQLVIAGPDQIGWQVDLQQMALTLGIADRITWTGMLSGKLKWGAYRCAELFCLPSHQENFGIVVAEALACGLPVAIADPVNIFGEIKAAQAGLVNKDTLEGTTAGLTQWLSFLPEERNKMAQNSLSLFRSCFNFASVSND